MDLTVPAIYKCSSWWHKWRDERFINLYHKYGLTKAAEMMEVSVDWGREILRFHGELLPGERAIMEAKV